MLQLLLCAFADFAIWLKVKKIILLIFFRFQSFMFVESITRVWEHVRRFPTSTKVRMGQRKSSLLRFEMVMRNTANEYFFTSH